jgi:hypothetical protein
LYPATSTGCGHNYQCAGSFYCDGGTCAASKPDWHAIDLSDQTDFVNDGLGPLSLSLTSNSHPVIGYGAKENDNDIVRAKVYNSEFLWQEVPHGDKALFVDVVVHNGSAIAAYNYDNGTDPSTYSIVVQQDGQDEEILAYPSATTIKTRPVLAALKVTENENDTHHAWVAWVNGSGVLDVKTQTSNGAGAWSDVSWCDNSPAARWGDSDANFAADIAIQAIGKIVLLVWRHDAGNLKFAMNDDVGAQDSCWESNLLGIDQLGQDTLIAPQISFMKNSSGPVPIVAWHHLGENPVRDIKLARLHEENDSFSWKTISFHTQAPGYIGNIDNNTHDQPQIVGDWLNDNHFYLGWRLCDQSSGVACDYNNTTSEDVAAKLSGRALRVTWPDTSPEHPTAYAALGDSLDTPPISATGVQDLRLAADGIRLCIASYHLPLAGSNSLAAVGNIYMMCHDAESLSP